ncbi:uncharacterized protein PGTG_06719 [Puccinia graminis f. sp. tritici CRL 75-36-700-3]|uniref:Myb/SANT-like domain-containing protein n=1 Tax=Puccinia graminis f. sp. tritici (strain CRL 75-36-700-3 / race SCCL) TaxID=418459 RepID=E3K8L2_PUCGT|nr:uncharacterized protein PGTG_06719 [Puccinia graminis f. sp. tritici CRL 75-36-700-3]EFP80763.2 hypothetical protein PGTG_06719 [Puccinia graminis f. sp. tritici CRL 75-36-700-3]
MDALLDPAIFTSDFSEASLTNTPTPKNPATTNKPIPKARMPAAKAPKKNKKEKEDKTPPHSWTHDQKAQLLEGIADCIGKGLATDNGNLNKIGWTTLMDRINTRFEIDLNRDQIKNAKNKLRETYVDYKFLRDQSGFGWDPEKQTPTADKATWDELIQSHPRRGFGKLKDKPFPFYDLAHQVFSGTFATGDMADEEDMPDLNNTPIAEITPVNRAKPAQTQPSKTPKRPAMIIDPDDSDNEVDPESSAPPVKRTREGKNEAIKSSLGGISSAIDRLTDLKEKESAAATSQSCSETYSEKALSKCALMFSEKVSDETYIGFIEVLENENKARTFLTLARTRPENICEMWLQKEVSKFVSISFKSQMFKLI